MIRLLMIKKEFVYIRYSRAWVSDCNPVLRCFHCLGYGHTSNRCLQKEKKPNCLHCAKDHQVKDCENVEKKPKCINCLNSNEKFKTKYNTEHRANSENCKVTKKRLKMLMENIDYGN